MAHVRTLTEGNAEALRALESISQQLGNLLIDQGLSSDGTKRNEKGELVNEEGLPILEISEPLDELDTPSLTAATDEIMDDHHPEPISKLSPEALFLVRQRRDKILQMLEEEEEREEHRTEEEHKAELQRKRVLARKEMEKRMLNQGFEIERRRKAKELEVQMAKALVGNIDREVKPVTSGDQKKKVAFATPSEESKPPKFGTRQPMKMEVIERAPVSISQKFTPYTQPVDKPLSAEVSMTGVLARAESASSRTITFMDDNRDSDDESNPDDHNDTNSEISVDTYDDEVVLSAKRHRELALEYHKRREALGFHSNDLQMPVDSSDWNQENVPLDASLAGRPPKPSVSKFKESRISRHTVTTVKRLS